MNRTRLLVPLLLLFLAAACAHGRVVGGTFVSDDYHFSVALPGPPYEQVSSGDALVAVSDPGSGASIAVSVTPDSYAESSQQTGTLDFITRALFFFLTKKEFLTFEKAELGGAEARHVTLTGDAEGTELKFAAYVTRSSGLVYDLVMWATPDQFDAALPAFEKMASTFTFTPEGGK